jgi:outer membrane protein OmpA-like peptidoglycan-associated protein
MKKMLVLALLIALVGMSGSAHAAKVWKDMSWWGNTGATPDPVKDATRSGYWWWPTTAKSNKDDQELWGNRGIVYYNGYKKVCEAAKAPEPAPAPAPAPAPKEAPKAQRTAVVLNNVLFDFDKSDLKPAGKTEVDKLAGEMKAHPGDKVVVEGHTCDLGTPDYNMALSQRRASSVKAYLLQQGVDASRVSTQALGLTRPAVPNTSEENRKLNRRAEFKITLGD